MEAAAGDDSDPCEIIDYPFETEGKPRKRFYVNRGNRIIGQRLATTRTWEHTLLQALYTKSARGGSFVEVGANIGSDTVFASDYFKMCYTFEPAERHLAVFRKNMELNGVANVELFPFAVSDTCGTATLFSGDNHNSGAASLRQHDPQMTTEREVRTVTLDTALPESLRDITFIHIDTEGHDIKVLQGGRKFIARQEQKPLIKMEFQPRTLVLNGSSVTELIEFIDEFQYRPMIEASGVIVSMTFTMLMEMFYLWRTTNAWFDIYLAP